jgi:predicted GH43/DUF377 family glycosyl hydrolase
VKWRKQGRIYVPDDRMPWAQHYAYPPTPHRLNDELLRIYVGCCDENTVGRVGFVDVLLDRPSEIVRVSEEPVLDIGDPGCFDDNGVVPIMILPVDGALYLYYSGFQLGTKVKYFQFTGLAVSTDGGNSFKRYSRAPVLDRSDRELLTRTATFVTREGDRFRMYYSAGAGWTELRGKPLPIYNLRYMESADFKSWGPEGRVFMDFASEDEHVLGRPWILRDGASYRMFYSIRTKSKDGRIGFAVSDDGVSWERRDDEVGIDVSETGWDSLAVSHPSVVEHEDSVYLFYCGNERGKVGFGYAELEHW